MSDILERTPVTERETGKEPAKRWRNRWRLNCHCCRFGCHICGYEAGHSVFGAEYVCQCVFPSRELAEQDAAEEAALEHAIEYLGPEPAP